MKAKEVWRPVVGAPDYSVSSQGRVRSKRQILKPVDDRRGYYRVTIKGQNRKVHLLVAEAYIPEDAKRPIVNHIDGDKHNNKLENLERVTHAENAKHAWDNGLCGRR